MDAQHAYETIEWFIESCEIAFDRINIAETRAELKKRLSSCDDRVRDLRRENLAGHFLNMDLSNQVKFLQFICHGLLKLDLPQIPDWKERAAKLFEGDPDEAIDQECVRRYFAFFDDVKPSDWLPEDLLAIRSALLYFNNNSTPDVQFGNFRNWSRYFCSLTGPEKFELCKTLYTCEA